MCNRLVEVLIERLGHPDKPCKGVVIALSYNHFIRLEIKGISNIERSEKLA